MPVSLQSNVERVRLLPPLCRQRLACKIVVSLGGTHERGPASLGYLPSDPKPTTRPSPREALTPAALSYNVNFR